MKYGGERVKKKIGDCLYVLVRNVTLLLLLLLLWYNNSYVLRTTVHVKIQSVLYDNDTILIYSKTPFRPTKHSV